MFWCVVSLYIFTCCFRAGNNFPASAGQIVRSNLFFIGHIAIQYPPPPPLHMMFKHETSKFSKYLLHMSRDLIAVKVERVVQRNHYHICAHYYCFSTTSYILLISCLQNRPHGQSNNKVTHTSDRHTSVRQGSYGSWKTWHFPGLSSPRKKATGVWKAVRGITIEILGVQGLMSSLEPLKSLGKVLEICF